MRCRACQAFNPRSGATAVVQTTNLVQKLPALWSFWRQSGRISCVEFGRRFRDVNRRQFFWRIEHVFQNMAHDAVNVLDVSFQIAFCSHFIEKMNQCRERESGTPAAIQTFRDEIGDIFCFRHLVAWAMVSGCGVQSTWAGTVPDAWHLAGIPELGKNFAVTSAFEAENVPRQVCQGVLYPSSADLTICLSRPARRSVSSIPLVNRPCTHLSPVR